MRKFGARPKAEPCTAATPSASSKLGDEILVGLDDLAGRRRPADRAGAGREDVEGAFRARALQILRLVEHGDDEIAAALERLAATSR